MFDTTQCTHELFVIEPTETNFTCEMEGQEIGLLAVAKRRDLRHSLTEPELEDLGIENHPFSVSVWLVPDEDSIRKEAYPDAFVDGEYYPETIAEHGKGVPINPESARINDERDKASEVLDFNHEGNEVAFKEWTDAERYITEFIPQKMPVVEGLVGFYLDKSINRIGTTGWDKLKELSIDPDYHAHKEALDRITE